MMSFIEAEINIRGNPVLLGRHYGKAQSHSAVDFERLLFLRKSEAGGWFPVKPHSARVDFHCPVNSEGLIVFRSR
jgi:hypothetical protein